MRYRDTIIEMAVIYLSGKPNTTEQVQLLLSNNPKFKDQKIALVGECVENIKELIKENA